jgi:polysaccharide biosynthesis/export protein
MRNAMLITRVRCHRYPRWSGWPYLLAAIWAWALPAFGQDEKPVPPAPPSATQVADGDYALGPGDIITVTIADTPEIVGKFRVTETGYISLPMLPTPVKAEGLTTVELSKAIAGALKAAQLYRDPVVSVFVEEFHSRTVTVLGAVAKPSVYPIQKSTTVLEVISMAGGLAPQAGSIVTVLRNAQPENSSGSTHTDVPLPHRVLTLDLRKLEKGMDASLNAEVRAGDVVSVSMAPIVYVVGAVTKPGGYVLQEGSSGATVLQALAMAEGIKSVAAPGRTVIVRGSPNGPNQEEIPVDLGKILSRKAGDYPLEPNDILFIPESGMKKTAFKVGEYATQALIGISIYGFGYKLGQGAVTTVTVNHP